MQTQLPITGVHYNTSTMPFRTRRVKRTDSSVSRNSSDSKGSSPLDIYVRRVQSSQGDSELRLPSAPGVTPLYRIQELVWLVLETPIPVDIPGKNYLIHFWPGIVEKHDTAVTPPTDGNDTTDSEIHYQVKILSLDRTYRIPQRFIAPFQTHSADENIPQGHYDKSRLADLHSIDLFPQWSTRPDAPSASNQPDAKHIPLLLLFDVKVTRMIASFWSATETRSFARPVDIDTAVFPSSSRAPTTIAHTPDTSPPSPTTAGSVAYRELWWGAESIRPGDLLRLSFTESRFTHAGAASACFADDIPTEDESENSTTATQNRSRGCIFLGLRTLIPIQENTSRTLNAVGRLYKLVPAISSAKPEYPKARGEAGLPLPPEGYVFRKILTSDWEVQLSLGLVKGRYYPRLKNMLCDSAGFSDNFLHTMEGLSTCATVTPRYNVTDSREEIVERAKMLAS